MRSYLDILLDLMSWLYALPAIVLTSIQSHKHDLGEVQVNLRRFSLKRVLGEGAYAYVYLAHEMPCQSTAVVDSEMEYAVKKVLLHAAEDRRAVEREMLVQGQMRHPNVLRLVESAVVQSDEGGAASTAFMVFPAFMDGTLSDELERLTSQRTMLPTRHVVDIFHQLCLGVQHVHLAGYRHGDIKPLNVLITRPVESTSGSPMRRRPADATRTATDAADAVERGIATSGRYKVVLMDFGSVRPAVQEVNNRAEALALQEDAEAHCTATYRAPELFDVPSQCTIGPAVDVWSLGCTLYHCMYGASPFQKALDDASSLALAVINCRVSWPKDPGLHYPAPLHDLVMACLKVDPSQRPTMPQLMGLLEGLLQRLPSISTTGDLPDPARMRQSGSDAK